MTSAIDDLLIFLLAVLAALAASGCAAPPSAAADPAPVITAFRDCLETYYATRLERAGGAASPEAKALLDRRRTGAGGRLIVELERRGVEVPEEAAASGLRGLAPLVERWLHGHTEDIAFAEVEPGASEEGARREGPAADPGSFLIGGDARREEGRFVELAGRRERYGVIRYSVELCPPFAVWRLRDRTQAPRLFVLDRTIYACRPRFRQDPHEGGEAEMEREIRIAAAALLFRKTADPARRDAQILVALLDGEDAGQAATLLREVYSGEASRPAEASRLALEAIRAAGIGRGETDAALLGRLPGLTSAECHEVVKSALRPGGLLDTSAPPR